MNKATILTPMSRWQQWHHWRCSHGVTICSGSPVPHTRLSGQVLYQTNLTVATCLAAVSDSIALTLV